MSVAKLAIAPLMWVLIPSHSRRAVNNSSVERRTLPGAAAAAQSPYLVFLDNLFVWIEMCVCSVRAIGIKVSEGRPLV